MDWWVWVALGVVVALVLLSLWWFGRPNFYAMAHAAPVSTAALPPDDLALIEGIGPRINEVLQAAGIRTFADLAAAPGSRIEAVLREAGLSAITDPGSWSQQADLAARGRLSDLKALQETLKAGRSD